MLVRQVIDQTDQRRQPTLDPAPNRLQLAKEAVFQPHPAHVGDAIDEVEREHDAGRLEQEILVPDAGRGRGDPVDIQRLPRARRASRAPRSPRASSRDPCNRHARRAPRSAPDPVPGVRGRTHYLYLSYDVQIDEHLWVPVRRAGPGWPRRRRRPGRVPYRSRILQPAGRADALTFSRSTDSPPKSPRRSTPAIAGSRLRRPT